MFDRFAELQQNSNSSSSVYTCNYILTVGHDGFTNIGHARGHSKMTGYRYIITGTVLVCLRYMYMQLIRLAICTCIVHPVILQWSISNFHFFPQSFTSQNIFNTQNYIPYCLLLEFSDTYYNIKKLCLRYQYSWITKFFILKTGIIILIISSCLSKVHAII